ncbi:hypothetical protein LI90_4300 [Carbonactinospora thermoautotrophica]|uniref:Uncharacterized protein n=1 Tax=Carbonactinospora thermoautotrophica TaxID=1469144 RepID=A0A132MZE3_9ACTN|nr:hypothetical protein LI90_4300 [Carbonactinospora thermoautotrophica]
MPGHAVLQRHAGAACTTGGPLQNRSRSTEGNSPRPRALPSGPHRPYEGSQPAAARRPEPRSHRVLIAPTRGRNRTTRVRVKSSGLSSSPLRGVATVTSTSSSASSSSPHRPYEGSQRLLCHEVQPPRGVLIAPTRGRNPR